MSVLTSIRRALIIIVSLFLLVVLAMLLVIKKEINAQSREVAVKRYQVRVWVGNQKEADRVLLSLKGEGYFPKLSAGNKVAQELEGYMVAKDFPSPESLKPAMEGLELKGYACRSNPLAGENQLRLQVGKLFADEQLAAKLKDKLYREEKMEFEILPQYREVSLSGFFLVFEGLEEKAALSLKARLESEITELEMIPYIPGEPQIK